SLRRLFAELIPDAKSKKILEIGCGIGNIIGYLKPKYGVGIDISKNMVDIAREKHSSLIFRVMSVEDIEIKDKFDYILLADVIEHLTDVEKAVKNLHKVSHKDTIIIFSMINPIWEPVFLLAEKLNLKIPEGPHCRIGLRSFGKILKQNNFSIINEGNRFLVPKKIPLIYHLNSLFYKIPFIRPLGMIKYYVIKQSCY
ncbi:class I SAM-dependent methyltransferase, partial [bacterium]|nr:class I SAM-dependent methyltransferase [bacterium]